MTTTTSPKSIDTEYSLIPLEASVTTDITRVAYGSHLVPLDVAGDFDLPQLIAQKMPSEGLPESWEKWGRRNRAAEADAVMFYCVDSKFSTLLREPWKLIDTGAKFSTEINVSSYEDDPFPVALAGLFRKRCATRVFQDAGINVFVDMHVDGISRTLIFNGVPDTHELYCTKYCLHDTDGNYLGMEAVYEDFDLVQQHVAEGVEPTFVVYNVPAKHMEEVTNNGWIPVKAIGKGA